MAEAPKPPLVEISLKDANALIAHTLSELDAWLKTEEDFWSWMRNVSSADLGLQIDHRSQVTASLQQAHHELSQLDEKSPLSDLPQVVAHLHQYALTGLASGSPRAKYILALRDERGDLVAAAAAAEYLDSQWGTGLRSRGLDKRKAIQLGRLAIQLFELGIGREVDDAYRDSVEQLVANVTARLREGLQSNQQEGEALKSLRDYMLNKLVTQQRAIQEEWSKFFQSTDQGVVDALSSLRNTEDAYKTQMKLRAAVSYWTGRGATHKKAADDQLWWLKAYGIGAGIVILTGAVGLGFAIVAIVNALAEKSTTPLLFLGGFALLIASAILWVARLLVRVYFDERRRSHDATERATMAEAYAALTSEGLVSDAERVIVLSALFRPSGDGSTREDSAPESIQHAILAKLLDQSEGGKKA